MKRQRAHVTEDQGGTVRVGEGLAHVAKKTYYTAHVVVLNHRFSQVPREVRGVAEQKLHGQQAHDCRTSRDGEAELPLVRVESDSIRAAGDVGARLQRGLELSRQLVAGELSLRE